LERYRPGALGSGGGSGGGSNEERERHRRRLGFGENRLPAGSNGQPADGAPGGRAEGGRNGGKNGGGGRNRGDRRNRKNRDRGNGPKLHIPPNEHDRRSPDTPTLPAAGTDQGDNNTADPAASGEPESPLVLGGKRNWADYSFDEDLPVDPEPEHHDTESRPPPARSADNRSHNRSPRNGTGTGSGNQAHPPQQHEDLRNKLNRNRRQQQQPQNGNSNHHNTTTNQHNNRQEQHQQQQHSAAGRKPLPRPKKNTENFNPSHEPPEMRILCAPPGLSRYPRAYSTRDVAVVTDLFVQDVNDFRIYSALLDEIQKSGVDERLLWQSWHGDSHLIADDKKNWKKHCPTFAWIVERLGDYFDMNIQATRLNWYRDTNEWKPFHHDAAAVKPDKARTQNMTVAVSFGAERDAAFEHAKTKTVISMPQPNGTVYTFGRDVNILWRHGIPQVHPSDCGEEGRISIICWGWIEMFDM